MRKITTFILLEKDSGLRQIIKMILEESGYLVIDAASEQEIWESFKHLGESQRVECLICNVSSSHFSSLSTLLKASSFRNSGKTPSVINIFKLTQQGLLDLGKLKKVLGQSVA